MTFMDLKRREEWEKSNYTATKGSAIKLRLGMKYINLERYVDVINSLFCWLWNTWYFIAYSDKIQVCFNILIDKKAFNLYDDFTCNARGTVYQCRSDISTGCFWLFFRKHKSVQSAIFIFMYRQKLSLCIDSIKTFDIVNIIHLDTNWKYRE